MSVVYILFQKKSFFLSKGKTNYSKVIELIRNFTNKENLQFSFDKNGRPKLNNRSMYLSIAHKKKAFLLAFSYEIEMGIDLEIIDSKINYMNLAKRFFHPEEYELIRKSSSAINKFFELWVKKEAMYKLTNLDNFLTLLKNSVKSYQNKISFEPLPLPNQFQATISFFKKNTFKIKYLTKNI